MVVARSGAVGFTTVGATPGPGVGLGVVLSHVGSAATVPVAGSPLPLSPHASSCGRHLSEDMKILPHSIAAHNASTAGALSLPPHRVVAEPKAIVSVSGHLAVHRPMPGSVRTASNCCPGYS